MLSLALAVLIVPTPDRETAAELIGQVLAQESAATLSDAAQAALDELAGTRMGARLEGRLAVGDGLRSALSETLEELTFEPTLEGDMPVGWPAPTALEEIEIKRYPVTRLARAAMSSNSYGPFMSLFRHISERDIPMTVPVEMEVDGDRAQETSMGFLYQGPDVGKLEEDGVVQVLDLEPSVFVSLGQRGRNSGSRIATALEELRTYVDGRGDLVATGAGRVLEYNGPSVRGARRFFEVQLAVIDRNVATFATEADIARWRTIDDRVMGGVSQSRVMATEAGTGSFQGVLSLESNGGFASARTLPGPWIAAGTEALVVRVRGDDQTYQLRLRTTEAFDGPSYSASFTAPAGEWAEITLPLADFRPTFRGREVRAEPLLPESVKTLGLLIADGQEGEFALEIDWIRTSWQPEETAPKTVSDL